MNFSALALGSKARNCPHLYFNSSVKLFIPHVPDSLNWCSNCFILEVEGKKTHKTKTLMQKLIHANKNQLCFQFRPTSRLFIFSGLSTVQTPILSYKDHSITVARQLASQVKNKAHKNKAHIILFIVDSFLWLYKSAAERIYIWVVSQTNAWYVMLTGMYISTSDFTTTQ